MKIRNKSLISISGLLLIGGMTTFALTIPQMSNTTPTTPQFDQVYLGSGNDMTIITSTGGKMVVSGSIVVGNMETNMFSKWIMSSILWGSGNQILQWSDYSVIGGGEFNIVDKKQSVIWWGRNNRNQKDLSVVLWWQWNIGNWTNSVMWWWQWNFNNWTNSVMWWWKGNTNNGDTSFLIWQNNTNNNANVFAWNDSGAFESVTLSTAIFKAENWMLINTNQVITWINVNVGWAIKIWTSGKSCSQGNVGTFEYSNGGDFVYCNGTAWKNLSKNQDNPCVWQVNDSDKVEFSAGEFIKLDDKNVITCEEDGSWSQGNMETLCAYGAWKNCWLVR